jgi:tetratricopeptide (TPR) repeat protein
MKKFIIVIFSLLFALNSLAEGQDVRQQKLQLAQSYESAGKYEDAARLYKELYDSRPQEMDYFSGVVRTYKALNKFSELLPIVKDYLNLNESPQIYALYGELLWKSGETEKANQAWQKAIDSNPGNTRAYKIVSEVQSSLMLFEKAAETLKQGRNALGKERAFADELSQLYIATGNYRAGTEEALNLLNNARNLAVAQGRLYALMANREAEKYIGSRVEEYASDNSNNILAQLLYAWYATTAGQYEMAFEAYKKIDELKNSGGREVLNFANRSRSDGQYQIALRAYEHLIDNKKTKRYLSSALYGYARTQEMQMKERNKLKEEDIYKIIDRYRDIIDRFPKNANSADCKYRIALLAIEQLGDIEMATDELKELIEDFPKFPITATATNLLGKTYIMQDEFDEAERIFKHIINGKRLYAEKEVEQAMYNMAQLHFFRSEIDSAKKYYARLAGKSDSDVSNNSLLKMFLINQNTEHNDALRRYGSAEMQLLKNDFEEAARIFIKTAESAPNTTIGQRSYIEAALAFSQAGKPKSASTAVDTLLSDYPESLYADYALLIKGDAFVAEGLEADAIETYKKILVDHPNSIYLTRARDKIRRLREKEL